MKENRIQSVFFSYGHDANRILVERLADDLRALGFRIWIDRDNIREGDNWRREITDGIVSSEMTFAFASQYSVRSPGVCLDELNIAVSVKAAKIQTILLEKGVEPPANIAERQYIDMSDWTSHYDEKTGIFDAWYTQMLDKVVAVLEDPKNKQFSDEVEYLRKKLRPYLSEAVRDSLTKGNYYGRTWLDDQVTAWMQDPDAGRILLITGAPGVGKSAFTARQFLLSEQVAAAIYCKANSPLNNPDSILRLLIFRLCLKLSDYRALVIRRIREDDAALSSAEKMFNVLLIDPLSQAIDGNRGDMIILLDGLDEANVVEPDGTVSNPLAEALNDGVMFRIPNYFRLLITCRPDPHILNRYLGCPRIHIDEMGADNLRDIRAYIREELQNELSELDKEEQSSYVEDLCQRSEGIFLYISMYVDEIKNGRRSIWEREFPKGLYNLYNDLIKRAFRTISKETYEDVFEPPLAILAVLNEPIPEETFRRACGWGKDNRERAFYHRFGSFVVRAGGTVRVFHKSFLDWLFTDKVEPYYYGLSNGDLARGRQLAAESCFSAFTQGPSAMNEFELLHLAPLLESTEPAESGQWLKRVLESEAFLDETANRAKEAVLRYDYERARKLVYSLEHLFRLLEKYGKPEASFGLNARMLYCCAAGRLKEYDSDLEGAREWYEKGLSLLPSEEERDIDWRNVARLYSFLAFCFYRLSKYGAAEATYRALVDYLERCAPGKIEPVLDAKIDLARTYRVEGACDKAFSVFAEIHGETVSPLAEAYRVELDGNPRLLYKLLLHEAWTCSNGNRLDEAMQFCAQADALAKKVRSEVRQTYGEKSANGFGVISLNDMAMVYYVQANLFRQAKQFKQALDCIEKGTAMFSRLHGSRSLQVCDFYDRKGEILQDKGDEAQKNGQVREAEEYYSQAESLYEWVYTIRDQHYAADNFYRIFSLRHLIYIKLRLRKDYSRVRQMLLQEEAVNEARSVTDEELRQGERNRIDRDWAAYHSAFSEHMENLVWETFRQEEHLTAELRLTVDEVSYLEERFDADCRPMDGGESDEKRWYYVRVKGIL